MTATQFETRTDQPEHGALIASRTDNGYRVYSIDNPKERYLVQQDGERWTCTCPNFEAHKGDATWRCMHILAVAPWTSGEHVQAAQPDNGTAHATVPAEPPMEPPSEKKRARKRPNGSAQMLIKRSVSPDGRIDSVSVEFSMPVVDITNGEIKDKAVKTLELQKEIVGAFLKLNAQAAPTTTIPHPQPSAPGKPNGKPISARMTDIGKVNGKWGERFCINVQVNGRWSRIFGSADHLAAEIERAGHHIDPANIQQGLRLNLPCLVLTKPSDDGKYLDIEQVFPVAKGAGNGGANGNRPH